MPDPLRVLIVEDEYLPRAELRDMLSTDPGVRLVAEVATVEDAANVLRGERIDLVLLDVQLGAASGFDLIDKIDRDTAIVFVTAYDEYALRAFEVNAIDYLLKPIDQARLSEAVARAARNVGVLPSRVRTVTLDDRLFLQVGPAWAFVRVGSIVAVLADGDFTRVILDTGSSSLSSRSMDAWQQYLPAPHFDRIHRSALLNFSYADRVEKMRNGTFRVFVKQLRQPLPVSRRRSAALRESPEILHGTSKDSSK